MGIVWEERTGVHEKGAGRRERTMKKGKKRLRKSGCGEKVEYRMV